MSNALFNLRMDIFVFIILYKNGKMSYLAKFCCSLYKLILQTM